MNVIPGSPLDLLAQQFAAKEQGPYVETIHETEERRILLTARGIDHKFAVQTKVPDAEMEEGGFWQIEEFCSSPVAAAMWALI